MSKPASCANCEADALYMYDITESSAVFYCDEHLPKFLYARRSAGTLSKTTAQQTLVEETKEILSSPKTETATAAELIAAGIEIPAPIEDTPAPAKKVKKAPVDAQPDAE
jgi:hypothetical protein